MYTGKEDNADTKANVYLNLFGEHGDCGKRQLIRSNNKVPFQRGQVSAATAQRNFSAFIHSFPSSFLFFPFFNLVFMNQTKWLTIPTCPSLICFS